MARGEANLKSKSAREKLRASGKPYYRLIDAGLYVGYRKGKTGGKWVARRYLGDEKYLVETIATADDAQEADGATILDFSQAQDRVRVLAAASRTPATPAGPYTVGKALDAYTSRLEDEASKSLKDARSRIAKHIRPLLGDVAVADLTRDQVAGWLKGIADRPRHVRGKKDQASRALAAPATADERRRRKASANRTLTILRAALNQAFRDGKAVSDVAWRTVKPFREVEAARVRYFTMDEVRRLVNAAQGDFRALVQAALFTGCRYGELCAARTGDFNRDAGTLFIAQSKSGKARHVVLTDEGARFFGQFAAGRATDALLLAKANGEPWGASHQLRPMAEALKAARITGGSFHILRHTAASHNVMGGVPIAVVAQNLGHADTRMTERHYAHMAPSYVAEQLRKFAPTFGLAKDLAVTSPRSR